MDNRFAVDEALRRRWAGRMPSFPSVPALSNSSAPGQTTTPAPNVKNQWGSVALVALATFVVVSAEMMPIGLLSPIGAALTESEGTIGLSLTITGLVAATTAPFMPIVTGRFDRRPTLVILMLIVAAANALTAVAPNFAVLAIARVLLGVSMGGVWALAASLAPNLARPRSVGLVVTIIFSGIALASVFGVPVGTYIGDAAGWNAVFGILAAAATSIALAMVFVLPKMPSSGTLPLSSLKRAFRNPGVRGGLTITALLVTAHFAAYTYVRPALESIAGLSAASIGTMLLIYGIVGIVGTFISGPSAARSPKITVVILSLGVTVTLLLLPALADTAITAAVFMAAWGLFYGGVSVSTQTWIAHAAPAHREAVSALWVGIFNASIAFGAFTGGQIHDGTGPRILFWIAGGVAAISLLWAAGANRTSRRRNPR